MPRSIGLTLVALVALGGCMRGVPLATGASAASADPGFALAPFQIGPVFQTGERAPLPAVDAPTTSGVGGAAGGYYALVLTGSGRARVGVLRAHDGVTLQDEAMPPWLGPGGPHASADGRFVTYVGEAVGRRTGALVLWDLVRHGPVSLPGLAPGEQSEPDIDGGGRLLIYLTGQAPYRGLALYDVNAGTERPLLVPAGLLAGVRTPTLSANGRRLAYVAASRRGDDDIYVLDVESARPVSPPTLESVDQDADPALSADGTKLAFSSDRAGTFDLYAYDLQTANFKDMASFNSLADESQPRFLGLADDGFAYVSTREGSPRAYVRAFGSWR